MDKIGVKSKTIASRGGSNRHNNEAKNRRARRNDAFSMCRNLEVVDDEILDMDIDLDLDTAVPEGSNSVNAKAAVPSNGAQIGDRRRQLLEKWKEEKNQKKKAVKSSQKPIFITGIVHHSVGSPNLFKTTPSVLAPKPVASKKGPQIVKAKSPFKMYVAPQRGAQTRNMAKKNVAAASSSSTGNIAMKGVPCNTKFKAPKGLMSIATLTVPHTPKGMAQRKRVLNSVEVKRVVTATSSASVGLVSPRKRVVTATSSASVGLVSPRKRVVTATSSGVSPRKTVVTANSTASGVSPRKKVVIPAPKDKVVYPRKRVAFATPNDKVVSPRKKVVIATPRFNVVSPQKKVVIATPKDEVVSPRKKVVIATPSVNVVSPRKKAVIPTPKDKVVSPRKNIVIATLKEKVVFPRKKVATPTPSVNVVLPHSSCDNTTNITDEVEEGPIYFRNLLDSEIVRLTALCTKWESVRPSLPESASEDLLGRFDLAIGMTQLLVRSKLQQFRGLTEECERGDSEHPVLSSDLRGFWELVGIQISAVDKQFDELEELRARDWAEKAPPVVKKARKAPVAKAAGKPATVARNGNGIRAMIAATRKKQLEEQSRLEEKVEAAESSAQPGDRRLAEIRATPAGSAKRLSLLQRALSASAAKRAGNSSPIVMRLSRRGKLEEGTVRGEEDMEGVVRGEGGEAAVRAETATVMEDVVESGDSRDSGAAESQPESPPPSSVARTATTARHRKRGHLRQCVVDLVRGKEARGSVVQLPTANTAQGSGKENAAASWNSSSETQAVVKKLAVLKVANDGNVPTPSVQSPAKSRTPAKGQRRSKVQTPARTPRVYQKTPHNKAAQLGDRVSLLPCQTETTPTYLTSAMDDLISFDTPVRRSTRLAKL